MSKIITLFALLLLLALPAAAQEATEESPTFTFYNSPNDRFHVLIPPGWEDRSTDTLAHFVSGTEQIYTLSARTGDTSQGMASALESVGLAVNPFAEAEVRLSNGTWQQKLYTLEDGRALTAFGQSFEGMTYTVAYLSETGTRPLIASGEDEPTNTAAALALLGAQPTTAESAGEITLNGISWGEFAAEGEDTYTVVTRSSGSASFVFVQPAEAAQPPDVFFYTLLVDFFVTPETTDYLALGIAAVSVIMLAMIGTMWLRWRNLRQDMRTLDQLGSAGA
jgi:hypothetical protein